MLDERTVVTVPVATNRIITISDAPQLLPACAASTVYLAIIGTPDGGRNELSLKNDFTVLVTRELLRRLLRTVPISNRPTLNKAQAEGSGTAPAKIVVPGRSS